MKHKTCLIIGHEPCEVSWLGNIDHPKYLELKRTLIKKIKGLYYQRFDGILCGMRDGVEDLLCRIFIDCAGSADIPVGHKEIERENIIRNGCCSLVIAVWNGDTGSETARLIRIASEHGIEVDIINIVK